MSISRPVDINCRCIWGAPDAVAAREGILTCGQYASLLITPIAKNSVRDVKHPRRCLEALQSR